MREEKQRIKDEINYCIIIEENVGKGIRLVQQLPKFSREG